MWYAIAGKGKVEQELDQSDFLLMKNRRRARARERCAAQARPADAVRMRIPRYCETDLALKVKTSAPLAALLHMGICDTHSTHCP